MPSFLKQTAQQLFTPGKGILASDERITHLNEKFAAINIPQTPEMRRSYRELLLMTPSIEQYLSGVILAEDTMTQTAANGIHFVDVLKHKEVLVGVKVDLGTTPLPYFPGEVVTEGLDGLSSKLKLYKNMGASFAKWRMVVRIGDGLPTDTALFANSQEMARFAGLCQEYGLLPIIEPEVVRTGSHSIDKCSETTLRTLLCVFRQIESFRVNREEIVLKTNMVTAGETGEDVESSRVAEETVTVLTQTVPDDVAGVVFLSGGIAGEKATEYLSLIAQKEPLPWPLTFSFLRALEQPALDAWLGRAENVDEARKVFLESLQKESLAELGKYKC